MANAPTVNTGTYAGDK
ncbi:hypothetical protein EYZ11_009796 [Aspergillus tanneri]|uniref:Uncharacterized protein n=1 Tax=Aspergillus tanneri TaxID=1220188 RepID=A0A4S3J712_9EURO|nr:hypothetical protein EYZ11_009796 [Aspergillus tanneri]